MQQGRIYLHFRMLVCIRLPRTVLQVGELNHLCLNLTQHRKGLQQLLPALPPDEPPGTRLVSQGFFTGPHAQCSVEDPIANSSQFVFPTRTAPAFSRRSTTVALNGLLYPLSIFEPQVVVPFLVTILSLIAIHSPCKTPSLGSSVSQIS